MPNDQAVQIREGLESDAPALAGFAARTFEETFGADNRPADMQEHLGRAFGIAQQTRELLDPNMVTLLTHQGEVLVAFAQVQRKPPPPCVIAARPIELHRFYVDRPAHGRGIAHQLMNAVHHVARSLGGEHLWLGVWERNPRAIAFYKKSGFADCGSTVFYVGEDPQIDRVMIAKIMPNSDYSGTPPGPMRRTSRTAAPGYKAQKPKIGNGLAAQGSTLPPIGPPG